MKIAVSSSWRFVSCALLLWVDIATAQTTGVVVGVVTDAISGQPMSGVEVTATSPSLQGRQTAQTDATGSYRLTQLPPGKYKLEAQLDGYRPAERGDITLRVDKTLRADLALLPEKVEMEEQVIRTGLAPVVNVGSAETGVVASKDLMNMVPLGRNMESAEAFAPMSQKDRFGYGFAGAQSTENNYLIDGLNVTDPRYGNLGTQFLPNFFEEVDVKTGAFMPEYGRTTAGIVSAVLKSGSNEYHGSAWANWTPRFLLEPEGHASGRSGEAIWIKNTPRQGDGAFDLDAGLELGGPVEKDKLWFYLGFAPVFERTVVDRYLRWKEPGQDANGNPVQHDIAGSDRYYSSTSTQFQSVGKLTYLFDPDHSVSASLLWAPKLFNGFDSESMPDPANGTSSSFLSERWSETIDFVGHYTGKVLDDRLLLDAQAGLHYQFSEDRPKVVEGLDQAATPFIRWKSPFDLSNFEGVPPECRAPGVCSVARYVTGGRLYLESSNMRRFNGRLSAAYLFNGAGPHNVKGGLDLEVTDFHWMQRFGGDISFVYQGNDVFTSDVFATQGAAGLDAHPRAISQAYFLQDSWQVADTALTLNYGLRWELQSMEDSNYNQASQLPSGNAPQRISIDDNIAPRLQAIYDFTGQGRGKVAANWGRFYESIPLYLASRAFGAETSVNRVYQCSGVSPSSAPFDPRTAAGCRQIDSSSYGGVTPVAPDLKGMYVDQFGLAAEYELVSDLSVGVEWQARRLGRVIEDLSPDGGNTYLIANPGESRPWTYNGTLMNPREGTITDASTGRQYTVRIPKPQRDYDGFTLKLTKNLSNNWLAQASYTYSVLRGNYVGFYVPEKGLNSPAPNYSSEYDYPQLMTNRAGLLPGDITHQLKLFGAYVFRVTPKLNITAGGSFLAQSGTPLNALGAAPSIGRAEVFLIQRGQAGRSPALTQVDLKGQLEYLFSAPYAFKFTLEVFNLFNSQTALDIDQNYTFDNVQPIAGAQCRGRNGANGSNPISGIQNDCPDLRYLKTSDGRPVTVNGNYGRPRASPRSFQLPISLRVGAALTF